MFRQLLSWANIVHYHFPWPLADLLHFYGRVKVPTLVTYHSDIVRQQALARLYAPLMNRFLGSVDRIVCTSPNYLETSRVLARFKDGVDIVPIGLDRASYPDPPDDIAANARAGTRRGILPVHRRIALLQVPSHPARRHARRPVPGGHRRLGANRSAIEAASEGPGPGQRHLRRPCFRRGKSGADPVEPGRRLPLLPAFPKRLA